LGRGWCRKVGRGGCKIRDRDEPSKQKKVYLKKGGDKCGDRI